jgi:hypothetical protein
LFPKLEICNLFISEADRLTFGSPRNIETLPPDLIEKMSTERDNVRGMIEPADERLCLLPRSFPSGDDGRQVFFPGMVLVSRESNNELPCPDLPTENDLALRTPPLGG